MAKRFEITSNQAKSTLAPPNPYTYDLPCTSHRNRVRTVRINHPLLRSRKPTGTGTSNGAERARCRPRPAPGLLLAVLHFPLVANDGAAAAAARFGDVGGAGAGQAVAVA